VVTTADSTFVLASDTAPADDAPRATWRRAAACAAVTSTVSIVMMLACAALVQARPGLGDPLIAALAAALALAGIVLRDRPVGDAALRVAGAIGFLAGAVGAIGLLAGSAKAPPPVLAVVCLLAAATLWRLRRPAVWRLSDTFLSLGAAVALTSLVAWSDPLNRLAHLGTEYPAMRPLTGWVALAISAALWSSHHRFRRLGWLLLGSAAVPLALTFIGKIGGPTPSAWFWARGLLPTRDAPLVGNYSDVVLAIGLLAVALRLRDPRREQGRATALSRGLGVAIASVSGMAVIGLVATIDSGAPDIARGNFSLGASVVLFMLGAALAVDRDGGLRDGLLDASPLVVTLTLGGLFWWGTMSDRDAFERRSASAELAQLEALLHQDLEHRATSVGRLSYFVDALSGPAAQARFARQVQDLSKHNRDLVHARAETRDGAALAWGRAPAQGPTVLQGRAGVPVIETAPGGWWITVPGHTGTAAFLDLAGLVQRRLASHDGAPLRVVDAGAVVHSTRATKQPGGTVVASRSFDLDGYRIVLEALPDRRLRGFVLSRTAIIGSLSAGLLVSFVLFLYELARSRAQALVLESQRRLETSEELARAAGTDGVTGLARFSARASALAALLDRESPVGWLILIDLDAFGSLNDALGHEAGDEILRVLARRVDEQGRGMGELLRFGGEGFALFGTDDVDIDTLRQRAERLRHAIGEPVELGSLAQHVKVTASIGIARMPEHGTRLKALLRSADLARLAAKRAGRNQTHAARVVDAGLQRDRLAMTAALRDAIANDEIRVAYQPIVEIDSGRITSFEALARWHHPQWGDVSPVQFIPLAESSGLMERLGEAVMRTACSRLRQWQALGFADLSMSVNVSPSQFGQGTLPALVSECVQANGLDPRTLTLEVTESMLIEDVLATAALLEELKRLGVRLALDDFGTGYSSLAYLQRLPLDVLKIDRSFVRNVVDSENDAAIIRMIMALSEQMRLQTVAEGVEAEAQQACLRAMGCTRMQGYRFARPCFSDDATALLLAFNGVK
jgi:diguanylate cyclase (GGDEF)-like protein